MSEVLIRKIIETGFLISPDLIEDLKKEDLSFFDKLITKFKDGKPVVLNKDIYNLLKKENNIDINWKGLEESRVYLEIGSNNKSYNYHLKNGNSESDVVSLEQDNSVEENLTNNTINNNFNGEDFLKFNKEKQEKYNVTLFRDYIDNREKKKIESFVSHYKARYNKLKNILKNRAELSDVLSINRVLNKKLGDKVSVICMVSNISVTKNNHIVLEVEDLSGAIKVLVMNSKKDLYEKAKEVVMDEVIGIKGALGDKILFADDIIFPGGVMNAPLKKCDEEVYAAFISDIHVGSVNFLEKEFNTLVRWINGEYGSPEQKEISKKLKYLFIAGDLVDGVGIYPGQEERQTIKDIYDQYKRCAELLDMIRKDVAIIVCPGNHDAVRLAEVQPVLDYEIAKPLWELPNLIMVPNPSTITIHKKNNFEGFDVLMYHGYSFYYYTTNMDKIRNGGGYDRPDIAMKYLLEKRHLAPTHGSSQFIPDPEDDYLVIDKLPDIFTSGHLHKAIINQYSKVTTIASSCWQEKTDYDERTGKHPEPGRLPLVNLKTRETKMFKFIKEE